jgi:hypothetical protein
MFIKPGDTIEVKDDEGNVMVLRARMDFATRSKVQDELVRMNAEAANGKRGRGGMVSMSVGLGTQQLLLLKANLKAWRGPDFDGVPCTPEMIDTLDPYEPLVEKALEEIGQRNAPRTALKPVVESADPNPNASAFSQG